MQNIDRVFFINLEKRTDRLMEIKEEFKKININNYERFNAIPTAGFGILGCTKSHCEVFKIAKQRNYKNILIFEDDFTFLVDKETFHEELTQIFNYKNFKYDVIMFSYNLKSFEPSIEFPSLMKVKNASTASCYLINGNYLDILINLYETAIPLLESTQQHWIYANDVIWNILMEKDNWYATNKRIGIQRPSFSDNSNEFMNHGC
jgi:GR25 family glycosyltransferase involved in LPS biosynthesis